MLKTLQRKEDNYYKMFSKIEVAMMRADSQMQALMGFLMQ